MGCGSSRTQNSMIREMYREPSEFDTCSTVVSGRENRGEPDGKEVTATVGDPPNNCEHQMANRKLVSRSPYTPRIEDTVSRNKTNGRPEAYRNGQKVIFTALTEHNDHDVISGDRHLAEGCTNTVEGVPGVHEVPVMRGVPEEERDLLVAT